MDQDFVPLLSVWIFELHIVVLQQLELGMWLINGGLACGTALYGRQMVLLAP
jgi:hypothetical protein